MRVLTVSLTTAVLCLLCQLQLQETTGRLLKTTAISVRDKELVGGPWKHVSVESQASLLHPLPAPCGGVIVIGYETISYYSKGVQHAIDPPLIKVSGRERVDKWEEGRYEEKGRGRGRERRRK